MHVLHGFQAAECPVVVGLQPPLCLCFDACPLTPFFAFRQIQGVPATTLVQPVQLAGVGGHLYTPVAIEAAAARAQYEGLVGTMSTIVRQEGVRSLYNGLSAGLQRQCAFVSVRLGLYETTKEFYQGIIDGECCRQGFLFVVVVSLTGASASTWTASLRKVVRPVAPSASSCGRCMPAACPLRVARIVEPI